MGKLKQLSQFISTLGKDPYEGMDVNERKLAKVANLLKVVDENVTKKDFEANFKILIDLVKKIIERNIQELKGLETKYTGIINDIYGKIESVKQGVIDDATNEITKRMSIIRNGFDGKHGLNGKNGLDGKNGRDGKDGSPDTANDILNKISGLLTIDDIKGLRDLLEEVRKIKSKNLGSGGLRPSPTGVETPSGDINGVNKAYVVTFVPQYITLQGQVMYPDNGYVLSSSSGILTITLDDAPLTGNILRSHY